MRFIVESQYFHVAEVRVEAYALGIALGSRNMCIHVAIFKLSVLFFIYFIKKIYKKSTQPYLC